MTDIAAQATGRWPAILAALGVDERILSRKHSPCPVCGGRDRFRFTDYQQRGMWICNQCGTGDGFDLLQRIHGWSFSEAAEQIKPLLPELPRERQSDDKQKRAVAALNRLRREAVPAAKIPAVEAYLLSRGLIVPPGIEAPPALGYWQDGREAGRYPAMLGRVLLPCGTPATYHRTYLHNGKKAPVESPRKLMTPARPIRGGAIRLFPAESVLGIAEGIETAIAAHLLFGLPVWSVIDAAGIGSFEPPVGVRELVIFGDCDANYTGQSAAYAAANRLSRRLRVDVRIPDRGGDWNDVLLQSREAA